MGIELFRNLRIFKTAEMKKRYHFVLQKKIGNSHIDMFLYLRNGKFFCDHHLYSRHLLNWWQAHWYWLLFNLPKWYKKNGNMFGYPKTVGTVFLRRLDDTQLK